MSTVLVNFQWWFLSLFLSFQHLSCPFSFALLWDFLALFTFLFVNKFLIFSSQIWVDILILDGQETVIPLGNFRRIFPFLATALYMYVWICQMAEFLKANVLQIKWQEYLKNKLCLMLTIRLNHIYDYRFVYCLPLVFS